MGAVASVEEDGGASESVAFQLRRQRAASSIGKVVERERNDLLSDLFKKLDYSSEGRLSADELFEVVAILGLYEDQSEFLSVFQRQCEENGWSDRGLTFEQFAQAASDDETRAYIPTTELPGLIRKVDGRWSSLVKQIFAELDSDGTGYLGAAQMYQFATLARCTQQSQDEFIANFEVMCREYGWNCTLGPTAGQFADYLSEECGQMGCTQSELQAIVGRIERLKETDRVEQAAEGERQRNLCERKREAVADSVHSGWLHKRGPIADYAWVERFCRLKQGILEYFEDELCEVKKGDIEFGHRTAAVKMGAAAAPGEAVKYRGERPFGFVLDVDPEAGKQRRLYYFDARIGENEAANKSNLETWIEKIKAARQTTACVKDDAGEWTYMVLQECDVYKEAQASRHMKTGERLEAGSLQTIVARAFVGDTTWLRLPESKGWVAERAQKKLQLSQVFEEEIPESDGALPLVVQPRLKAPLMLHPFVFLPAAVAAGGAAGDSDEFGTAQLHAGTVVKVLTKAKILMPGPKPTSKECEEVWKHYLRIKDPEGREGWISSQSPSQEDNVTRCQISSAYSDKKSIWISVLPKAECPVVEMPGRSSASKKTVKSGELLEVEQKLSTSDLNYFKLADKGGWVCETDAKGKQAVDVLEREPHEWIYVCQDKDGVAIKKMPTREKIWDSGKNLRHRQRGMVAEKVTFTNGDVFLRLQPPSFEGWVPTTKRDGNIKMKALQALPSKNGEKAAPPQPQVPQAGAGYPQQPMMGPPMMQPFRMQPMRPLVSPMPPQMVGVGAMSGMGMMQPGMGPMAGGMGMGMDPHVGTGMGWTGDVGTGMGWTGGGAQFAPPPAAMVHQQVLRANF